MLNTTTGYISGHSPGTKHEIVVWRHPDADLQPSVKHLLTVGGHRFSGSPTQ